MKVRRILYFRQMEYALVMLHLLIFLSAVSRTLRENTYPFLALIVIRNSKLTVVLRIEGPIEPDDLVAKLTRAMRDNEGYLAAARQERADISQSQNLRQQQDVAYMESLRQDEEKVGTGGWCSHGISEPVGVLRKER